MRGLSHLEPAEKALLHHRWAELAPLRDAHAWARELLGGDAVGQALADAAAAARTADGGRLAGAHGRWDEVREEARRTALGQVFTPPALARALAALLPGTPASVLDPACGDGSLLVAALDLLVARGLSPEDALARMRGWDADPHAAWLARARLAEWAAAHGVGGPVRVEVRDALAPSEDRVQAVIANPPYLEAKRMNGSAPGLRERLRARFPALHGAWDLYCAFLHRAEELVDEGGHAAFLVPSKVLQARYAARLRAGWVGAGPLRMHALVDCAAMQPRPFPGTSVYPALIGLHHGPTEAYRARRVRTPAELAESPTRVVPHRVVREAAEEQPIFVPFASWGALAPCFALPRLGQIAAVASTCSFHKKGLREQFVSATRPEAHAWPYLGGESRTRRTEVGCFAVDWRGYWIRFDSEALRTEHDNPLPPLATFARPKVIFCQHARRVEAVLDVDGRFVTKDTYPVAWPTDPRWDVAELAALLNSTVFTALYNTLYQGVRVGGETYHYLPAFLREVPVPDRDHPALAELDAAIDGPEDPRWDTADRAFARAYGVGERELFDMRAIHLERVGASTPPSP